jgi:molybdopterin synthase sulfur carrier subunit
MYSSVSGNAFRRYFSTMSVNAASTLRLQVLLFGSYAEALGYSALEVSLEQPASVADAIERLRSLPGGDRIPPRPLVALNLTQVGMETLLSSEDELAVLPPLSGG